MARVGGTTFPKMLAQFEAWAFHNGADGRPDTADDLSLGLVDATWSMEEYAATYDDDDIKYVGTLDAATGRFTPNIDGPNPARKGSRNNIGDVWVVAKYTAGRHARDDRPRPRAPAGDRAALHAFRSDGGPAVTLGLREFHPFEAAGRRYVYLVPSAAVFALDDCSEAMLDELRAGPRPLADLASSLSARFDAVEVTDTIAELQRVRVLGEMIDKPKGSSPPAAMPKIVPLRPVPLQTLVRQRHQPVQPRLHLLLRVRRGQDRRHHQRPAAQVHERGDGARERRVCLARVAREHARAHHVLRRRDADELPGAEGHHCLCAAAGRRGWQGHRLQPDHQCDAAAAGGDRVPGQRTGWRHDLH